MCDLTPTTVAGGAFRKQLLWGPFQQYPECFTNFDAAGKITYLSSIVSS